MKAIDLRGFFSKRVDALKKPECPLVICSYVLKLVQGACQHEIVNKVRHYASGSEILRNRASFEQQPRRLYVVLCETENAEVGPFQLFAEFLDPDDAWIHMGRDEYVQAFAQYIQEKGLQGQRGGSAAVSRPTDKNSLCVQFDIRVYRDCLRIGPKIRRLNPWSVSESRAGRIQNIRPALG